MKKWAFRIIVAASLWGVLSLSGQPGSIVGWVLTGYLLFHARAGVYRDVRRLWAVGKNYTVKRSYAHMKGGAL